MSEITRRIDEHIEFHSAIDSHKSDVAFLNKLKTHIVDLKVEFKCFVIQNGCNCGHPKCTKCRDSNDANELISK